MHFMSVQVKKPGVKKTAKVSAKGGSVSGGKKKKTAQKFTVDCTHPVEDGIMDPANFVRVIYSEFIELFHILFIYVVLSYHTS